MTSGAAAHCCMSALEARLDWRSEWASHSDRLIVDARACQGDGRWLRAAEALHGGREVVELDATPWLQPRGLDLAGIPAQRWRLPGAPVAGRFYPRLAFPDLAQGPRDLRPVRLLEVAEDTLRVDANHALAGREVTCSLRFHTGEAAPGTRLQELFDGPGLQAPPADTAVAYLGLDGFGRRDESEDGLFYDRPRLVHHLDAVCRREIAGLYARFLRPGLRVLDLMSSWESHLPDEPSDLHVAGLGMNRDELMANPRLNERVVKDLNQRADLPWNDAAFDLVLCTASVEYLLRPLDVLREARRVLRPGGLCVLAFSDRWFPDKAIRVWSELHSFERLGMALSLLAAAGFGDLRTQSLRGLKRPEDDKYAAQRAQADPLFAAWGVA